MVQKRKINEAVQQIDYYPYGLPMATSTGATANRYKYSGKEFETRAGLNSLDFHARQYAPALPLFDSPDPLAIENPWHSSYLFCGGNPINMIDRTGLKAWPVDDIYKGVRPINSNDFGNYEPSVRNHPHGGVDINIGSGDYDLGAPVYATHDGVVVKVVDLDKNPSDTNAGGSRVKIQSLDQSVTTFYMHLDTVDENITEGTYVSENQQIGTIGGSGYGRKATFSPHLHYEMTVDGTAISPSISATQMIDPQSFIKLININLPEVTVVTSPPTRSFVIPLVQKVNPQSLQIVLPQPALNPNELQDKP